MISRFSIGILALVIFLAACNPTHKTAGPEYYKSVEAWQKHRVDGLRKPDSWLTLVGLFWLKPGAQHHRLGRQKRFRSSEEFRSRTRRRVSTRRQTVTYVAGR